MAQGPQGQRPPPQAALLGGQPDDEAAGQGPHPRLRHHLQGLPAGGRPEHPPLRRAAPLHPGPHQPGGLQDLRDPHLQHRPPAGQVQVRAVAGAEGLLRPDDGQVPGQLPGPAAAVLRPDRARLRRGRLHHRRRPDRRILCPPLADQGEPGLAAAGRPAHDPGHVLHHDRPPGRGHLPHLLRYPQPEDLFAGEDRRAAARRRRRPGSP